MSELEKLINPTWKIEYKPDIQEACVSLWCNNADNIPVRYITIPLNLKDYNMRLLAAAPDMYRILKAFALCTHEDGMFDLMEEAGELIARIDGKEDDIHEEVHRKRMEAKR